MRLMKTSLTKTETEWNGITHFDLGAADINSGSVSTNTQLFSISTVFAPHTIFITRYATIQEPSSLYRGENAKSNQILSLSLIQIFCANSMHRRQYTESKLPTLEGYALNVEQKAPFYNTFLSSPNENDSVCVFLAVVWHCEVGSELLYLLST